MNDRIPSQTLWRETPVDTPAGTRRRVPAWLRHRTLNGALAIIAASTLYWGVIASDRYVSEANVVVDRTELAAGPSTDFASLLGAKSGHDLLLLREHLLSTDMLVKLDDKLDLRTHYSDRDQDVFSRMWSPKMSREWFHRHYLSRVSVEYDDFSGVLRIKAQAYSPEKAQAVASMLVEEGERFMNDMGHRLAREQVSFLERQVEQMSERVLRTRQAVVAFQNSKGLASPQGAAEALGRIAAEMESQLAELKTRREVMRAYLSPTAPDVVQLNYQIQALEKQRSQELARLASPAGNTLNKVVEEHQRLQLEAEFAQKVYQTALTALERGRIEATRTLKKVSVVQAPGLPQYPLEPRRLYNIALFALATLVLAGVFRLFAAIIRDHKD